MRKLSYIKRHEKGSPNGGRFAKHERSDADLDTIYFQGMKEDTEPNAGFVRDPETLDLYWEPFDAPPDAPKTVIDNPANVSDDAFTAEGTMVKGGAQLLDSARLGNEEGDSAFIEDHAVVSGMANVLSHSQVSGDAHVSVNAKLVSSQVSGKSIVTGSAEVRNSKVKDNAVVSGFAVVRKSEISGTAVISGHAEVNGVRVSEGVIDGDALISSHSDLFQIRDPKGSVWSCFPVRGSDAERIEYRIKSTSGESSSMNTSMPPHSMHLRFTNDRDADNQVLEAIHSWAIMHEDRNRPEIADRYQD